MGFLPAIPLLLALAPAPQAVATGLPGQLVSGEVELDRLRALETAERRLVDLLWERFGPELSAAAGAFVPEGEVERSFRSWVAPRIDQLALVDDLPMREHESTVGTAYEKLYCVRLKGDAARGFLAAGARRARDVGSEFRRRFLVIGAILASLVFAGHRLDRATRGYLTGRIRLASLVLGALCVFVLYP